MKKIAVTHVITGLNMGGAETMLYKLLKNINNKKYNITVISMMDEGIYGSEIMDLGFEVISLNMKQGRPTFKGFKQARLALKNTDIIQTWMYHADLFGYLLYKTTRAKKLIWGIRRNNLDSKLNKRSTILIAKINSLLSKKVHTIVSCSIKAKKTHVDFGFNEDNMIVIPNGFEMNKFEFNSEDKIKLGNLLKKPLEVPYLVHVGRWNILKDHKNFLEALKIIKNRRIDFHAAMIGPNINNENDDLVNLIEKHKLIENITLLDKRDDVSSLMSGGDIFVSSSIDEGFPNVIGEAMACQVPCVVTDAGDSAYIVGNTGIVVPPKDAMSLANGIMEMLDYDEQVRKKIGLNARQRVLDNFDIKKIVKQYEDLYII